MKGQYKVLTEVILFGLGVAIASFVILSFQTVQTNVIELAVEDNMRSVSNLITTAVIKVAEAGVASMRLEIPKDISEHSYIISVDGDLLVLASLEKPDINVTQQLFNITQNHNIIIMGNVLSSSSRYLEVSSEDGINIIIRRWGV